MSQGKVRRSRLKKNAIPSQNLPKNSRQQMSPENLTKRVEHDTTEIMEMEQIASNNNPSFMEFKEVEEKDEPVFVNKLIQVNTLEDVRMPNFFDLMMNDACIRCWTGLSCMKKFETMCAAIEKAVMSTESSSNLKFLKLSLPERVCLTLMKLKSDVSMEAIANVFKISTTWAFDIFFSTIDILHTLLTPFVQWISKDKIRQNMPLCFKPAYVNTRVIVDCTEVTIQSFTCLICKTLSYSSYKCKHTIKFLIGISPSGTITFVSKVYGGRTSDKFIFLDSGLLEKCDPSDAIMTDKGFLVKNECSMHHIELIQPPFVGRRGKLSSSECDTNCKIAKARVHVERIMQRIKVFGFMRNQIELGYLKEIDQIITVICALVNFSAPINADHRY